MADRFYINLPLAVGTVVLEGAEAHHLLGVRRFRPGDRVCLFNGDGYEYPARVVSGGRRSATLEVFAPAAPPRELPWPVSVAAPLPKGDRAQFLLEKLTELGVTAYVPLHTRRSVVHPHAAKMDKLQRYVIEASKQCGRNVLMRVESPADWEDYCRRGELPRRKWLAHPGHDGVNKAYAAQGVGLANHSITPSPEGVALAVGPEGGFTEEEIAAGAAAGWQLIDLGPRTLRVETAALVLAVWAALQGGPP
jgi:16S rRNA (uracil1498-N3)-methyltransferase